MRSLRIVALSAVVVGLLVHVALSTGCATAEDILAPYSPPKDCAAIDTEMLALAKHDAMIYTIRGVKEGGAVSVGLAASAGLVPAGWVWVPLGAALLPQIKATTYGERIAYLAFARLEYGCPAETQILVLVPEEGNSESTPPATFFGD